MSVTGQTALVCSAIVHPAQREPHQTRPSHHAHSALAARCAQPPDFGAGLRAEHDHGYHHVGRSTFYAHHGSKEGLLLAGLQHLRAALIAAQRESAGAAGAAAPLGFSREFFKHVHDYREIYRALVRSESAPTVTTALKRIVADIVSAELRAKGNARGDEILRDALVRFTVDAFFSILDWWFERNPALAPGAVDTIFRRLVVPALAAAESRTSR